MTSNRLAARRWRENHLDGNRVTPLRVSGELSDWPGDKLAEQHISPLDIEAFLEVGSSSEDITRGMPAVTVQFACTATLRLGAKMYTSHLAEPSTYVWMTGKPRTSS